MTWNWFGIEIKRIEMLQMDNELPQSLTETIFIPKNTYHRVIKGTGDLVVRVKKL
jgi:hypothetical protein